MALLIDDLFASGALVRPDPAQPGLVHLVRAMASVCGIDDVELTPPARALIDVIGLTDHLVFVLIDGLGMNTVARLPTAAFIARHLKRAILASSPSTTACALTSVASTQFPSQHGMTGWFTHFPEHDLTATVLPFIERFTKRPLGERGLQPEHVLPEAVFPARMWRDALTVLPRDLAHTPYATWSRGGTAGAGYTSIGHAIDLVIAHVNDASSPTYTHLYLPEVDALCHTLGVAHPDVVTLTMQLDMEMARLKDALGPRATVVISADHGLIDVPAEAQTRLEAGDAMMELLACPPSGDARMPVFHVKPAARGAFVEMFKERFAERVALLDVETVERMELFGPAPMTVRARQHFGDFVGVHAGATSLGYRAPDQPAVAPYRALHAGLSPQEMWVPVCVA